MPDDIHPCPRAFPDAAPDPAGYPLRVDVDPATGRLLLDPDEAIRLVLALKHLASFVHWARCARFYDEAIADEAEWLAEILGDRARTGN
jgi:hypothetical protein